MNFLVLLQACAPPKRHGTDLDLQCRGLIAKCLGKPPLKRGEALLEKTNLSRVAVHFL